MLYAIYHADLPARVVNEDEFHSLLKGGEWFDRPQTNNFKGNSDETKRLFSREEGRDQPGQREHLCSRPLSSGKLSGKSDARDSIRDETNSGLKTGACGENRKDGLTASLNKRGRPKKSF